MPIAYSAGGRVAGSYLQPLLEAAAARGVGAASLARAAGLAGNALSPLPPSVAAPAYVRLLETGARLAGDPHFGLHVGERMRLGTYHAYGLMLLSCRDFGQALQQTLRYEGLAHDLGRSTLRVIDGIAEYRWHSALAQASPHLAESVFAGIRVCGNWLAGRPLPPARIAFMHAAPADCREHQRIFGAPVAFGAAANTACFDAALLSWPVPHADVGMFPVLRQHAEQLLQEKQHAGPDAGIVMQVRAAIACNLAQDRASLSLIAEELQMPQRTLQRRLRRAGISFRQVLDQTRRALAQQYLRQPGLSIAEIAFLLGYQEQSSFNHAFKGWTGVNPGAYRGDPTL
jgi:AraC-like DNA-binding protein